MSLCTLHASQPSITLMPLCWRIYRQGSMHNQKLSNCIYICKRDLGSEEYQSWWMPLIHLQWSQAFLTDICHSYKQWEPGTQNVLFSKEKRFYKEASKKNISIYLEVVNTSLCMSLHLSQKMITHYTYTIVQYSAEDYRNAEQNFHGPKNVRQKTIHGHKQKSKDNS